MKYKLIGLLALFSVIFVIYKIYQSDETATSGDSIAHDNPRGIREFGGDNRGIKLRQPTTDLERKRISHFANDGVESFGGFPNSILDPDSKEILTDLVNARDFHAALHFLSDLGSEPNSQFFYTLCFQWAMIDRDACLAAITSADVNPEVKHGALMGMFQAVANEPDPDTLLWVENMLVKSASVPGLDVLLGQIAAGWVATGVMQASDFVSLWNRHASHIEEPFSSSSIFMPLDRVARYLSAGNSITVEKSDKFNNEYQKISDLEMSSISADLLELFDSLPIPDDEEHEGRARNLASSLGEIEGRQNGPTSLDSLRPPSDPAFQQPFFEGVGAGLYKHRTTDVMQMVAENKTEQALVWKGYVERVLVHSGHADILYDITHHSGQLIPEALQAQAARQIATSMLHRDSLQASKEIAALPNGLIRSEMIGTMIDYLHKNGRKEEAEQWERMK